MDLYNNNNNPFNSIMQSVDYQKLNAFRNGIPIMQNQFDYGFPHADNGACTCPCFEKCECCLSLVQVRLYFLFILYG